MIPYRRYASVTSKTEKHEDATPETHGSYGALLLDRRWKDKRAEILARDLNRCVICGQNDNLEVHHRQYHYVAAQKKFKAPWEYESKIMITLCSACHQRGHAKFKVPIINT